MMQKWKTRKMCACNSIYMTTAPEDFFVLWLEMLSFRDQLSSHSSSMLLIWTVIKVPLWSQQGLLLGHAELIDLLLQLCVIKDLMKMTESTWALLTAPQLEKDIFLHAKIKSSNDLHLAGNKQAWFQRALEMPVTSSRSRLASTGLSRSSSQGFQFSSRTGFYKPLISTWKVFSISCPA